ncbi:MAG: Fic family protein [Bacilli bacterium]|nr:Fic family protein [Bacilli bacterium]
MKKVKKALIEQKNINLSGNLYHKTQIEFAYNTNHLEGSTITPDETASIYDSGTILTNSNKVIVVKDVTETKNHFTLFKYMLETIEEDLTEEMIKKYHFILKEGTLTDEEKEWFNVGEYKKLKNFVGNIKTSLPNRVKDDMALLLKEYRAIQNKTLEDIIEFHVKFERIHPFQDGNGRVGRMIMFRECLKNNIMPFYIEDRNKDFYIRGIKEYQTNNEKGYLIDTIKNSQDNYEKLVNYFLENEDEDE